MHECFIKKSNEKCETRGEFCIYAYFAFRKVASDVVDVNVSDTERKI